MTQTAVVERPDSATHFLCDSRTVPVGVTHHLVRGKCLYCKRTDAQIREEAGL